MEEVVRKMEEEPWYAHCSLDDVRCFINANLRTAARSAVAVGYYLKQVRDRELWMDAEDAGYTSVWDFAQEEFGISKSTASRYMSINDRFSEGGNSPLIMEKYAELSKSQLQEMLYLTDRQTETITPETTVQQIRAMREPKPEPVEVLEGQMSLSDLFGDVVPEITSAEPDSAVSGSVAQESAENASYKTTDEPMEPCAVTLEDLIPEEETAAAAVAISQQTAVITQTAAPEEESEVNPGRELPMDLIELIYLTVHNYRVDIRRICEDNPEIDPQEILDCARHFMAGGI